MKTRAFGFLVGGVVVLTLVAAFAFFRRSAPPMEQVVATQPSPEAAPVREVGPQVSPVLVVDGGSAAARFEGEVQEPDGTPIEAEVDFFDGTDTKTVRSGPDGRFSFTARPGSWQVAALRAEGFVGYPPELKWTVAAGVLLDRIKLTMSRASRVQVLVLLDGRPVPGAHVNVFDDFDTWGAPLDGEPQLTDRAGRATLEFLPGVNLTALGVSHECCLLETRRVGATQDFTVELTRVENSGAQRLVGRVVDESNQPLAAAEVTVMSGRFWPDGGRTGQHVETLSDSLGGFVANVFGGSVRVFASHGSDHSEPLDYAATDTPVIVVKRARASVAGRVVDGVGRPVNHFEILIRNEEDDLISMQDVRTGDGRYRITKLRPGVVTVEASNDDFAPPARKTVELGSSEVGGVDFVLQEGARLTGLVRAAGSGRPIAGARVTVDDRDALTDDTGHFQLTTRTAGVLAISVEKSGFVNRETQALAGSSVVIELRESSDGGFSEREFEGIGARLDYLGALDGGNGYTIEALHPEGGAKAAGLEVGDEILRVEAVRAGTMPFTAFNELIRGPEGTVVRLTIRRGDRVFDANVVRRKLVW